MFLMGLNMERKPKGAYWLIKLYLLILSYYKWHYRILRCLQTGEVPIPILSSEKKKFESFLSCVDHVNHLDIEENV